MLLIRKVLARQQEINIVKSKYLPFREIKLTDLTGILWNGFIKENATIQEEMNIVKSKYLPVSEIKWTDLKATEKGSSCSV